MCCTEEKCKSNKSLRKDNENTLLLSVCVCVYSISVRLTEGTNAEHQSTSCHLRELLSIPQSSNVSAECLETRESQGA